MYTYHKSLKKIYLSFSCKKLFRLKVQSFLYSVCSNETKIECAFLVFLLE